MVFETAGASVYQVRRHDRNEEVREAIPADYPGVLITDRGQNYDAQTLVEVPQQKCLARLQRYLSDVLTQKQGWGKWFAGKLKRLLGASLGLWHWHREGEWAADPEGYAWIQSSLVLQLSRATHLTPHGE